MNNQQEEKKFEVTTKKSTAVQIAIGIAVLAIVAAGGGLVAHFALAPAISQPVIISDTDVDPGPTSRAFNLLTPADEATNQDDQVTLTWETCAPCEAEAETKEVNSGNTIKVASLGGVSIKLADADVNYQVFLGTDATNMVHITTVPGTSYTATNLMVGTTYYWKIRATFLGGTKTSTTWSFSTAGMDWLLDQGYTEPPPAECAACGANRQCDADDILNCTEWNDVWLACNGIGNKCPDNLTGQCLQMTVCQCSGVAPGSSECADYITTFTDPCGGY